jgi:hypothetical protein
MRLKALSAVLNNSQESLGSHAVLNDMTQRKRGRPL